MIFFEPFLQRRKLLEVEPERLDYIYLLPIFFDGLCEKEAPSGA